MLMMQLDKIDKHPKRENVVNYGGSSRAGSPRGKVLVVLRRQQQQQSP